MLQKLTKQIWRIHLVCPFTGVQRDCGKANACFVCTCLGSVVIFCCFKKITSTDMLSHSSDQDRSQGPTGCILHTDPTDALFRPSCPNTTFGNFCFSMSLWEGVVPSEASQIGEVTFTAHILGKFPEGLQLTVTGQPEPPTVTFGKSLWLFKLRTFILMSYVSRNTRFKHGSRVMDQIIIYIYNILLLRPFFSFGHYLSSATVQ